MTPERLFAWQVTKVAVGVFVLVVLAVFAMNHGDTGTERDS